MGRDGHGQEQGQREAGEERPDAGGYDQERGPVATATGDPAQPEQAIELHETVPGYASSELLVHDGEFVIGEEVNP